MAAGNRNGEKNLIRSEAEYNAALESFGGVDMTSPDGRCGEGRFPELVNMYRDWEREDGTALETIPGYRQLPKTAGDEGERIYGLFTHTFIENGERTAYVIFHKGEGLYLFRHDQRDLPEVLFSVASPAAKPSSGFSREGSFYLLDGQSLYRLATPAGPAEVLGDEPYTDELEELGEYPDTNVYIPTVIRNGEEYEDRNLLTDFYDQVEELGGLSEIVGDYGLKYRLAVYQGEEVLEVYGLEGGRQAVYVPSEAVYQGETLPVVKIAPGAFTGRSITEAVLSPSVKVIGGDEGENNGAFYGCDKLTTVVMAGVATIGADAFALCSSLETVVLPASLSSVASTAFYGTSSLKRVCFAGPIWNGSLYPFGSGVTVYPETVIGVKEVGDTLYLPCDTLAFPSVSLTHNAHLEALSGPEAYDGIALVGEEKTTGYRAKIHSPAALVGLRLKSVTESVPDRFAFYSFLNRGQVFTRREEALGSYRLPLPDTPRAVVSVTLDGKKLPFRPSDDGARFYYAIEYGEKEGKTAAVALRLTYPPEEAAGKILRVRCFGQGGHYDSRSLPDFRAAFPAYSGSAAEAVSGCRVAAVYDDRVFLSGNPALPGMVFYTVTPKSNKNASAYFGAHAFLVCGEGGAPVTSLLAHPNFLAVMKGEDEAGGGLFFCTPGAENLLVNRLYRVTDGSAAVGCAGASVNFRDDPVFLSRMGLCGIGGKDLKEERTVENRSFSVDRRLLSGRDLTRAKLAVWKGFLALLSEGEIFLADSRATYRKNNGLQYEWYYLADIGHYAGQTRVYRHMSHFPAALAGCRVGGLPLKILGREEPVAGEVTAGRAITPSGEDAGEVFYTDTIGEDGVVRCLVDSDGEMTGGVFQPAEVLVSLDGLLYFGTGDGCLFCFNTDKRGEAAVISGKIFPVKPGQIHNMWYTFNGRAYLSGFATPREDLGIPHLAKSTVRRSLVIKCRAMPRSRFVLGVRTEKEGWRQVEQVVASCASDETDFAAVSFLPETRQLHISKEHEKKWVEKQLSFSSREFRRPFGIYSVAYRYRMAGRPKI